MAARIVEVTASNQPDYTVAGRTISMGTYLTQLRDTQRELFAQLQMAGGPFEVRSYGR